MSVDLKHVLITLELYNDYEIEILLDRTTGEWQVADRTINIYLLEHYLENDDEALENIDDAIRGYYSYDV